jgi:tRNA U55 pseudouridine synthase TruB
MSALERSAIGRFKIEDALALESLSRETMLNELQPAIAAVAELPRIQLNDAQLLEIRNGRPVVAPEDESAMASSPPRQPADDSPVEWAAVDLAGNLVSILKEKHAGQLWPAKNLF